jgi:hypothetical protein
MKKGVSKLLGNPGNPYKPPEPELCRRFLDNFFDWPYWRRVWIIQEIAIAARVIIKCGNDLLPWENLYAAETVYTSTVESRSGLFSTNSSKNSSSMSIQACQEPGTSGYRPGESYSYVKQISLSVAGFPRMTI